MVEQIYQVVCTIITSKYKHILNIRYITHAINLISKDICKTPFANKILRHCQILKDIANEKAVKGGGLKH
ncbi:9405_t:CDS:2 [Diversispora eburnea]|uniref:9405_t:CDS:1 n=1 Tax=Diversispora eburnea TaxID=1213867 RepID=A0A9N9C7K6_9GLOM|nr:9405_t:CDS:2 [Diversispora eburnea]